LAVAFSCLTCTSWMFVPEMGGVIVVVGPAGVGLTGTKLRVLEEEAFFCPWF